MKPKFIASLICAATLSCLSTVQAKTFEASFSTDVAIQSILSDGASASCQFLDNGYAQEEDLYVPFATYTMTPEQQAAYLSMIQFIWQGPFWDIDPVEVNDEMAEVVNIVLWEIANCARKLGAIGSKMQELFDTFRDVNGNLPLVGDMIYFIANNQAEILVELAWIKTSWKQRGCIAVAAANWRSVLESAYWDEY